MVSSGCHWNPCLWKRIAPALPRGWRVHHAPCKLSRKILPMGLRFLRFSDPSTDICRILQVLSATVTLSESSRVNHCMCWNNLHHEQPESIGGSMVSSPLYINSPKKFVFLVSTGTTQMYESITLTCRSGMGSTPFLSRSQGTEVDTLIIFKI